MGEWKKYVARNPRCDLCDRAAAWEHPVGSRRCNQCPRPNISPSERLSHYHGDDFYAGGMCPHAECFFHQQAQRRMQDGVEAWSKKLHRK